MGQAASTPAVEAVPTALQVQVEASSPKLPRRGYCPLADEHDVHYVPNALLHLTILSAGMDCTIAGMPPSSKALTCLPAVFEKHVCVAIVLRAFPVDILRSAGQAPKTALGRAPLVHIGQTTGQRRNTAIHYRHGSCPLGRCLRRMA